jgi:hypothetical protein
MTVQPVAAFRTPFVFADAVREAKSARLCID